MRLAAVLILLLLPSASAATQVHVTLVEEGYAVTFVSESAAASIPVTHTGGIAQATRVDDPAQGDTDRIYRAILPSSARTYSVEGRHFLLPAPPAADASVRIVYVADMGTDENASRIVEAILAQKPSLVVIGGDLSYANGAYGPWNEWFELVEPLAANVPTMPAYGNHEDYCQDDARIYACGPAQNEWHAHFALPNDEHLFYAFAWGPIRFTVLDSEGFVHAEGEHASGRAEQADFLRASLAADTTRWDAAMFHRPLRSTLERDGATMGDDGLDMLGETLDDADLVLAAHVHAYERSHPLRDGAPLSTSNETREGNGTFHVTSGGGGRSLYDDWRPEEPWLATRASEFHFVVLDVTPTRLDARALRPDGTTLDAFALTRPLPPPPPTPTTSPSAPPASTTPEPPTGNGSVAPPAESATPGAGALLAVIALVLAARRLRA